MAEQANFPEDLRSENRKLREENQELRKMLIFDELTGLYKTLGLGRQEILRRVRQAMENNQALVLAVADLKRLRDINNNYSHDIGDQVLITVAEALKTIVGENGLAMRSHAKGDEFALMVFDEDRGGFEKRLKNLQKNGVVWGAGKINGNISFTLGIASTDEITERGDEGQAFQQLWELASLREREEHRRING